MTNKLFHNLVVTFIQNMQKYQNNRKQFGFYKYPKLDNSENTGGTRCRKLSEHKERVESYICNG